MRWFGGKPSIELVQISSLKSLSEGLDAHHKAQKDNRKWEYCNFKNSKLYSLYLKRKTQQTNKQTNKQPNENQIIVDEKKEKKSLW